MGPAGLKGEGHIFSVDVEEYFQVSAFDDHVRRGDWEQYPSRVDRCVQELLDALAESGASGTFFGWTRNRFPQLLAPKGAEPRSGRVPVGCTRVEGDSGGSFWEGGPGVPGPYLLHHSRFRVGVRRPPGGRVPLRFQPFSHPQAGIRVPRDPESPLLDAPQPRALVGDPHGHQLCDGGGASRCRRRLSPTTPIRSSGRRIPKSQGGWRSGHVLRSPLGDGPRPAEASGALGYPGPPLSRPSENPSPDQGPAGRIPLFLGGTSISGVGFPGRGG